MLTLPLALAAISAGLIGGVHCVGMCGGISTLLSRAPKQDLPKKNNKVVLIRSQSLVTPESGVLASDFRHQFLLQSGRLFTYMLIGMVFGGVGAAGMQFKPYLPVQKILFIVGNLALVLLGLRLLGLTLFIPFFSKIFGSALQFAYSLMPVIEQGKKYPFLMGMSWGCLPCGLLYGVTPFALLAGDALSGAVLMALFGLAALPHLLMAQSLVRHTNQGRYTRYFKALSACSLITIGLLGLWYFDMKDMPSFLCVTSNA